MACFALVDCNNFYVSCERVFQPKLEGKPVLVLSNNDGCVIARSNEVKAVGIKMGAPFFQVRDAVAKHGIEVFSSNYALYGDMSRRVHSTLAGLAPAMEEYSIDEAFLDLSGIANVEQHARHIRQTVKQWTGIPVSVGIGPTKVLAKIANHVAKKQAQHAGVFAVTDSNADEILAQIPVREIWGIGPSYARLLRENGIDTALALKHAPDVWVRAKMTVVGLRIAQELRGTTCLPLEETEPERKGIACTRSFGKAVLKLDDLREAVASYASRVGEKLRARALAASYLYVFVRTNQFNADPKYVGGGGMRLSPATAFTPALNHAAQRLLVRCYKHGFRYWKAGIIVDGLVQESQVQPDMFDGGDTERRQRLMQALDSVNYRFGRNLLHLAATGIVQPWQMRRERVSPRATTCWEELPRVVA